MRLKKTTTLGLIVTVILILAGSAAEAEEGSYSPAVYGIAALMVIDVGSAVANGIALAVDKPNRTNGYFGVVTGVLSLGLVAVTYAIEEDDDLRDDFSLAMGTAGLASLTLGVLNVRKSSDAGGQMKEISRVTLSPKLVAAGDNSCRVGIGIRITF